MSWKESIVWTKLWPCRRVSQFLNRGAWESLNPKIRTVNKRVWGAPLTFVCFRRSLMGWLGGEKWEKTFPFSMLSQAGNFIYSFARAFTLSSLKLSKNLSTASARLVSSVGMFSNGFRGMQSMSCQSKCFNNLSGPESNHWRTRTEKNKMPILFYRYWLLTHTHNLLWTKYRSQLQGHISFVFQQIKKVRRMSSILQLGSVIHLIFDISFYFSCFQKYPQKKDFFF